MLYDDFTRVMECQDAKGGTRDDDFDGFVISWNFIIDLYSSCMF